MESVSEKPALSDAQLAQREQANHRHGARSERRLTPLARNLKRNILRQLGLRASDVDPLALGYLELYVRALAKVRLYDAWVEEHGLIDEQGNSPGFMATYFASLNSARLALARLGEQLGRTASEPSMVAVLQGEARRLTP